MNIGKIVEMIRADQTIRNNVAVFLASVNTQNITQVVRTHQTVVDEQRTVSLAEMNGGPATQSDVDRAITVLDAEPIMQDFRLRTAQTENAVNNGTITTTAQLLATLSGEVKMREYALLTRDVTKTNIGTTYVSIPPGANGERCLVDFTNATQFRIIMHANLVATGPFGVRLLRDSDNAVLFENASVALTGERELDTDWLSLPAEANGLILVRLQAKSSVAADDPVFRRIIMLVR